MILTCQEGSYRDSSGTQVFYRNWPAKAARYQMIILHGFNDHSGRFLSFAEELFNLGISVTIPDLPGHGRTIGRRGHIPSIDNCLSLIERFWDSIYKFSETPTLLYAHSFGALLGIRWLETRPHTFTKAILESPYLKEGFPVPEGKVALGRLMAKLFPALPFKIDLPLNALCGYAPVVEAYASDPLVHNKITACTYLEILKHQELAQQEVAAVDTPVLMISGLKDIIIDLREANRWFQNLPQTKEHLSITEGYHECHNEQNHKQLLQSIETYIA